MKDDETSNNYCTKLKHNKLPTMPKMEHCTMPTNEPDYTFMEAYMACKTV